MKLKRSPLKHQKTAMMPKMVGLSKLFDDSKQPERTKKPSQTALKRVQSENVLAKPHVATDSPKRYKVVAKKKKPYNPEKDNDLLTKLLLKHVPEYGAGGQLS